MRLTTKLSRFAGATLTAAALLLGSIVAAPSATAATNVWADLHYSLNCSKGGYFALSSGPQSSTAQLHPAAFGLRHNLFKGGDNYGHGAWLTTIGAVLVQPHATVTVISGGQTYTFANYTGAASCQYQTNAGGGAIWLTQVTYVRLNSH